MPKRFESSFFSSFYLIDDGVGVRDEFTDGQSHFGL